MIQVNAIGDACPLPVIKTKKALDALTGPELVEVLVDNEVAVENLKKLAKSRGLEAASEKTGEKEYRVRINASGEAAAAEAEPEISCCAPVPEKKTVVVIRSDRMGEGDEALGKLLIKGYLYALTQLEQLPKTMLFYNSGAFLTCEGSASLEDLNKLAQEGVEILTCGTCLQHYGLSEKLAVGAVTNMYVIAETMAGADLILQP